MDILDVVSRTVDHTGTLVAGVRSDQWELPTPCTDWNVRVVVAHMVRGNQNTAAVGEGRERNPHPIAELSGDPVADYRASTEAVKAAWSDPAKLDALYDAPLGKMPGRALLTLRIADNVTHGWDLARATGQTPEYDDDVLQTALAFAEATRGRERLPGGPFAPVVTVPEDAPAIDRLVAMLGRQP